MESIRLSKYRKHLLSNTILPTIIYAITLVLVSSCGQDLITDSQSNEENGGGGGSITPKPNVFSQRVVARLPLQLVESSGIVTYSSNEIWSHEDSNNENKLYQIDSLGILQRTLTISNVSNIDWEDLAKDSNGNLYICDAGNNDNDRKNLAIHVISNPSLISSSSVNAQTISFVFSDQKAFPPDKKNKNYDIEGMIWYRDSIYLFTKNRSTPQNGYCKMYQLSATPGNYTAMLKDSIYLGSTDDSARVTSADLNLQTGELILLTATRLISFKNYQGINFFKGQKTEYPFTITPGQNEGIAFFGEKSLYMTEEGTASLAGNLYEIKLP